MAIVAMPAVLGEARILVIYKGEDGRRTEEFSELSLAWNWQNEHPDFVIEEVRYWGVDDSRAVESVTYNKGDVTGSDFRGKFTLSVVGGSESLNMLANALQQRKATITRRRRRGSELASLPRSRREVYGVPFTSWLR